MGFILFPYGEFYPPAKRLGAAKKGDILRFYNGGEYPIERVLQIRQDEFCDMLCRIRYGIPWRAAFRRWESNVVLEGHDRGVLSKEFCLWIIYDTASNQR